MYQHTSLPSILVRRGYLISTPDFCKLDHSCGERNRPADQSTSLVRCRRPSLQPGGEGPFEFGPLTRYHGTRCSMRFRKEVKPMCPWVETLGFCPYEAAATVWQWVQSFFA